jgi:hypothetical protein
MKNWKLVSGILSIVLCVFVLFQSCAAGTYNALEANGEVSGSAGCDDRGFHARRWHRLHRDAEEHRQGRQYRAHRHCLRLAAMHRLYECWQLFRPLHLVGVVPDLRGAGGGQRDFKQKAGELTA